MCEIHHKISEEATNDFFEIGKKWFPKLFSAKENEGVTKKVNQFVHIRKQLYKKNVPPINMEFSYLNKETNEITVVKDQEKTPTAQFPPNKFVKLCEIASVKVR